MHNLWEQLISDQSSVLLPCFFGRERLTSSIPILCGFSPERIGMVRIGVLAYSFFSASKNATVNPPKDVLSKLAWSPWKLSHSSTNRRTESSVKEVFYHFLSVEPLISDIRDSLTRPTVSNCLKLLFLWCQSTLFDSQSGRSGTC